MAESVKVISVGASSSRLETATKQAVAKLEDAIVEHRNEFPDSTVTNIDHQWSFVPEEHTDELATDGFMVTMVAVVEG